MAATPSEARNAAEESSAASSGVGSARQSPGIALLDDGKVLVAGGITGGSSGTPVQTSQVYNPVTKKVIGINALFVAADNPPTSFCCLANGCASTHAFHSCATYCAV